jgi:K+-transporting ATPase ATPase C chain
MKKEWLSATLLSIACLVILNGGFTAIVWGIAKLTPQKGLAERIKKSDGTYYYANIAQKFTDDKYFWPRPSAVDYNAAGSGGSNKGPSNPEYLKTVSDRIDSFTAHNPGVSKSSIPSELVTASGSGLDPNISVDAAIVQVPRIAKSRAVAETAVKDLIAKATEHTIAGLGPEKINVLRLNLELDEVVIRHTK